MHLEKKPTDQLPEQTIENRSRTYSNMMHIGYVWGLPIALGVVMFFTLLLMGKPILLSFVLGILAWLGVLGFSKTFFVH